MERPMEIRELEVVPVAYRTPPLKTALGGTYPEFASRSIVKLTAADGTVGIGETHGGQKILDALERAKPVVEGRSPFDRTEVRLRMGSAPAYGGLEMAMYDLAGKAVGESVSTLLGGRLRDSVEYGAYLYCKDATRNPSNEALCPDETMSAAALVEQAREFVDRYGFHVLKVKGGILDPDEEVAALRLLAEEFGSDAPLRIDPNGNWSVETATRVAKRLRELDANVQFLEDPVANLNAHRRLRERVDYPFATNMFVTSIDDVAPAVHANAVDVVLTEYHYCGGLSGVMKLDALIDAFDLGAGVHSTPHLGVSLAAMTHLGAAMESIRYASDTHYPWFEDDVLASPFEFEDGRVSVPDGPGLGVELDEDELARLNDLYHETDPLSFTNLGALRTELDADEGGAGGAADLLTPQW